MNSKQIALQKGRQSGRVGKTLQSIAVTIGLLLLIFLLFHALTKGKFLTPININVVLAHTVVPACMALAMTFIFITDTIDLSMGAMLFLGSNAAGLLAVRLGYPGLLIGGIGCGILMCVLNIRIVQILKIPSWICSLGMAMIYEAIAFAYSSVMTARGTTTVELRTCLKIGRMPTVFLVEVLAIIIAYILFNHTQIGINIRSLSGGRVASMMGVNAKGTMLLCGVIGGLFMGLACSLNMSINTLVAPVTGLSGLSSQFQPLAIFFMSQAIAKWINPILGVFSTSVFIMGLLNFLTKIGVPAGTGQQMVLGACIILFGILSARGTREVVK